MLTSLFFPFTSLHGECYRFLITPADDERNITYHLEQDRTILISHSSNQELLDNLSL